MSRTVVAPSGSRRTLNGNPVVAIGVDRRSVGRNNTFTDIFLYSRVSMIGNVSEMTLVLAGCMMPLLQTRRGQQDGEGDYDD
jgi:hypothetical protein